MKTLTNLFIAIIIILVGESCTSTKTKDNVFATVAAQNSPKAKWSKASKPQATEAPYDHKKRDDKIIAETKKPKPSTGKKIVSEIVHAVKLTFDSAACWKKTKIEGPIRTTQFGERTKDDPWSCKGESKSGTPMKSPKRIGNGYKIVAAAAPKKFPTGTVVVFPKHDNEEGMVAILIDRGRAVDEGTAAIKTAKKDKLGKEYEHADVIDIFKEDSPNAPEWRHGATVFKYQGHPYEELPLTEKLKAFDEVKLRKIPGLAEAMATP